MNKKKNNDSFIMSAKHRNSKVSETEYTVSCRFQQFSATAKQDRNNDKRDEWTVSRKIDTHY